MKPKTCKACRVQFVPSRSMQAVCGPVCAITLAGIIRDKAAARAAAEDRRLTRAALAKLKSRAALVKEAQTAFNGWIRHRDRNLPCVSCGRMHDGQWHAGHYLSTGARPDRRFDESNVAKQCAPCNTYLSGNSVLYRMGLIRRIGQAEVERLEGPATAEKLTRDQIIALRDEYRAKLKEAQ